jgi:hypothetical protein
VTLEFANSVILYALNLLDMTSPCLPNLLEFLSLGRLLLHILQGESCEVVVVFRPSSQRPYYEDELQVGARC